MLESGLPAGPEKPDESTRARRAMNEQPQPILQALLVDDDANFSALVRDVLAFSQEVAIRCVASVREMWAALEAGRVDAVLLDYKLPDGNGLDVLAEIARRNLDLPVVIVTGRGDERIAIQAIQAGAIDYHVKSAETVFELPVVIRKAVRNHEYRVAGRLSLEKIRYQALLLDNMRDAVVVWDAGGRIAYWNRSAEALYGWPAAERVGGAAAASYHALFEPVLSEDEDASAGEPVERRAHTRDGREIWIDSRVTALRNPDDGAPAGAMDVTRDVTGRREAQERLRRMLEFENLIASASAEFINLSATRIDARVTTALESIGRFAGAERAYVFRIREDGDRFDNTHEWCAPGVEPQLESMQRLSLDSFPWFAARIRTLQVVEVPCVADLPEEARTERELWQAQGIGSLLNVPMVYGGQLAGFLGFDALRPDRSWTADIVSLLKIVGDILIGALMRQRAEQRVQAAQTHLVQSARLGAIGELASGVAHQINNPLTAIIAEAQMLRRRDESGPARESADAIEQAGWKAQEAVQHLMEFSQPSTEALASLDVNETIRKAVRMVGAPIQAAGIRLETLLGEGVPAVRGYDRRLEDLWVNLLLLARDAASDGDPHFVSVRSFRAGTGEAVVEVSDDGRAIPAEDLEFLFEPHFAGPVAGRGGGMEYSICREIVRQHDGDIRATSSPDFGTIVRVTLPAEVIHGTSEHPGH